MKHSTWLWAVPALAALAGVSTALAADHLDGPGVMTDAATDITDVYSWMDGNNVVFVLNVSPLAAAGAKFSTSAQYVLHTASGSAFTPTALPTSAVDIIATFDANQKISLWVGADEYVTGDASATAGLASTSGKVKVFAGLRDDPFFFNLDGFKATQKAVEGASLPAPNAAGCPPLDSNTQTALQNALKTSPDGGTAQDFFAGKNVLSIVVSVDKSLVTKGGAILSVWGSTNKGN